MGQVDWTPELVRGKTETSFGVRALNPGLIRVNKFSERIKRHVGVITRKIHVRVLYNFFSFDPCLNLIPKSNFSQCQGIFSTVTMHYG